MGSFALRVRDNISKLTSLVDRLRSVREQLQGRARTLGVRKDERGIGELLDRSSGAVKKADALEDRLHNPTAEIVYDILAMRGGTRLYSRLSPLQMWAIEAEGAPTAGMTRVLAEQEKELADLERDTRAFLVQEVEPLNALAAKLGLPYVVVP